MHDDPTPTDGTMRPTPTTLKAALQTTSRAPTRLAALLLVGSLYAAMLLAGALLPPAPARAVTATASAQQAYDAAVVDLLVLEQKLASAQARLKGAQAEAARLQTDLASAQTTEGRAAADLAQLEEQRSERLRSLYKSRQAGWLEVLAQSGDLTQLLDRMFLFERIVRQETNLAGHVAEAQAAAAEATDRLQGARAAQQATIAELTAREAELRDARSQQEELTARLGTRLAEAKAEAAAARQRMEELNQQARGSGGSGASGGGSSGGSSGGGGGSSDDSGGSVPSGGGGGGSAGERPQGRQLTVKATAYALPGTTATGVHVRYGIVAVDPRVIPLGTRLWIPGYGEGLAADTGGAIKGNRIDVWLPSETQALDWGIKTITITILD